MNTPRTAIGRRGFLTAAAVGGAAIVGASALGGFDPDAAFAAPAKSFDPTIPDPNFAEGVVSAIKGSTLSVHGSYGVDHTVQLTSVTSIWKLHPTTADAIEVGDGLYARGVRMPDSSIAADAVWLNIVNIACTVRGISSSRVQLALHQHSIVGHVVPGTTVASHGNGAPTSDLSGLRIGQAVQVLGAWRPADNSVDVVRFTIGR
jgi:hypothetical protein